ncbi:MULTISPECIES: TIGR03759 family integrating conjugative element protein [unclassified Pseudomonas]|uniref:TIGR03759 family integrating conjugative element protein n=1 Tax=unclassified Pseudomonas TaxID=196821 RepID=UPI000C868B9F|nr:MULTISPECIES: TIGR03759 family integrating conjugative element protein [unclassified Pseudomonas]PMV22643.1 TIGR03759 family integrating conjugative element protein [Pseudomonas sp. FW305-3-2-15-C-TSA2]PMV29306.1 TIGR03759 family integrating conjugative element protein [Pseudomonas sp. DP16D-L5]PMV39209.1 TIGR03759 family integrating conjugative element protein [Pseudomonas sp. FW305-3-2-15-A-LB2]PMV45519.1 TIGR03759 family integrating conjugative element protein [Pseudomonas sp. FW305-3-2-1
MSLARLLAVALLSTTANADVQFIDSPSQSSTIVPLSEAELAQAWQLTTEEWARYRQLMQGPLGIYSPNLDPLSALGIEAGSLDERQRYAAMQVQAEAARVEKLVAYQRAYDNAWAQQFPGQLRVNLSGSPAASPLSIERLAVFVSDECQRCERTIQQLQTTHTAFDLYLVGSQQDDNRIRQWAQRAGVDRDKVRDRRITLNHDNGRWQSLDIAGELPAVLHQVDGQWLRQ